MSEDLPSPDGTASWTVERTRTLAARAITAIDPSGGVVDTSQPPDGVSDPYGGPVPGGAPPQAGPPADAPQSWAPAQSGDGVRPPGSPRPPEKRSRSTART